MKLLMICPTRIRPDRIQDMLASFDTTKSEGTEIVIYVSLDDPRLEEYKKVLAGRNYIVGPRRSIVQVFNHFACEVYPDVPYYGMIDDDHYFITKGWDARYIEAIEKGGGWGLACGEDHLTDWNRFIHPSGCVIDGQVVRLLGYFVWPEFVHIGTDMYLGALFTELRRLYRLDDVIIEHRHRLNHKGLNDDNYRWVYSPPSEGVGRGIFEGWKINHLNETVEKIREAIDNMPKPQ